MASLRQRDISKCWSHWKCSDCSVPLRTALLPHLQLKMFSILLSAYIWISPTCWAPVTASSWEGRRREQFERCRESCLWKHHLKKKKKAKQHNNAAASSSTAERVDGLSVVVWIEKTAALWTSDKLFWCTAPHLSGKDCQSFVSTPQVIGDQTDLTSGSSWPTLLPRKFLVELPGRGIAPQAW